MSRAPSFSPAFPLTYPSLCARGACGAGGHGCSAHAHGIGGRGGRVAVRRVQIESIINTLVNKIIIKRKKKKLTQPRSWCWQWWWGQWWWRWYWWCCWWWCLLSWLFAVDVDVDVDVDSQRCASSMFAQISTKSRDFKIKIKINDVF